MITIPCKDLGGPCEETVSGKTMDDVVRAIHDHVIDRHGYTVEQAGAPEKLELWRGAIRQTARPAETRTNLLDL